MRQQGKSILRTLDSCIETGSVSANSEARFSAEWAATSLQRLKEEDANSLLEYAFIAMLFMTMLLGIIDFGRALYAYHFVSHAAREATRYAAVRGSTCNDDNSCSVANPDTGPAKPTNTVVQDYVTSIVPSGLDSSKVTTTPNWPVQALGPSICSTTAYAPGCTVEVQVTYAFSFLYPFVSKTSLNLSSTSEMVIVH